LSRFFAQIFIGQHFSFSNYLSSQKSKYLPKIKILVKKLQKKMLKTSKKCYKIPKNVIKFQKKKLLKNKKCVKKLKKMFKKSKKTC